MIKAINNPVPYNNVPTHDQVTQIDQQLAILSKLGSKSPTKNAQLQAKGLDTEKAFAQLLIAKVPQFSGVSVNQMIQMIGNYPLLINAANTLTTDLSNVATDQQLLNAKENSYHQALAKVTQDQSSLAVAQNNLNLAKNVLISNLNMNADDLNNLQDAAYYLATTYGNSAINLNNSVQAFVTALNAYNSDQNDTNLTTLINKANNVIISFQTQPAAIQADPEYSVIANIGFGPNGTIDRNLASYSHAQLSLTSANNRLSIDQSALNAAITALNAAEAQLVTDVGILSHDQAYFNSLGGPEAIAGFSIALDLDPDIAHLLTFNWSTLTG